jgi:nicotinic acid phosphoribosyltransferase
LILTNQQLAFCSWSADNILFGTGGALLQKVNRDTQKVAFKCSNIVVKGEDVGCCMAWLS